MCLSLSCNYVDKFVCNSFKFRATRAASSIAGFTKVSGLTIIPLCYVTDLLSVCFDLMFAH